jgi:hypothetical protein
VASHTVAGQLWPEGTTVSVYPAAAWTDAARSPSGPSVASGTVAGGSVTFTGLAENLRYVAYGASKGVSFLVRAVLETGLSGDRVSDRQRIRELEEYAGDVTSRIAVLQEAPLNIKYPEYGAAVDNSTDDGAAWTAAFAAMPAGGGEILQPRGVSLCSARFNVAARRNVRIIGEATDNDSGGFGSTLVFTGTGASPMVDARNSVGFQVENMTLLYGSASFTGYMIDAGDNGGSDTRKMRLSNVLISGQTGTWTNMAAAVNLTNAVDCYFQQTTFMGGTYGVIGRLAAANYSNAHTFNHCKFWFNLTAHVKNAGESWLFNTPIIEGLQGDKAGFYTYDVDPFDPTGGTKGFTVVNGWWGDVLATGAVGAQMNWAGHGLTILGGRMGAETATVKGIRIAANNCHGIVILGTEGFGPGSPLVDWNGTTGHTGVLIVPGDLGASMALEAGTRPTGALVMDSTGKLANASLTGGVIAYYGLGHQINIAPDAGAPAVIFGSAADAWLKRIDVGVMGTGASQKFVAQGGLGVGNSAAATETIGKAVVKKIQVFDAAGASIGYVPVYSSIT